MASNIPGQHCVRRAAAKNARPYGREGRQDVAHQRTTAENARVVASDPLYDNTSPGSNKGTQDAARPKDSLVSPIARWENIVIQCLGGIDFQSKAMNQ
jgi:hypothetical protein